ncbi:MobA protein, partial [Bacteroides finegoldii]
FLKAHFFGQPFKVLKVDKTLVDYYTKLSDFHAQFRAVGTNYNQVVKELRLHFSEKKAMALLYKLEQHTVELVKLSRQIVELSRELKEQREQSQTCLDSAESRLKKSETQMEAKWSQKSV